MVLTAAMAQLAFMPYPCTLWLYLEAAMHADAAASLARCGGGAAALLLFAGSSWQTGCSAGVTACLLPSKCLRSWGYKASTPVDSQHIAWPHRVKATGSAAAAVPSSAFFDASNLER